MGDDSLTIDSQLFTGKESEVIFLLLQGKSTKEIAISLAVSPRAVEHHLTHIYAKLGVCTRVQAVIKLIHLFEKQ
jgi:DNA-binding CsgD family transcriptional regulator